MRWIWLVVLCACGDNVVPRLTPLTHEVAGTTFTVPEHFHDQARDEECSPVTWADAATYCTPAYRDAVYTNSGCSDPIAAQGDARYVATYFSLGNQSSLRRLHPVTHALAAQAQYWQLVGATCEGPYTPDPAMTFSAVGAELDESAFVRLYRSAPEGGGRLQQIAWNTTDGLHVPAGFHDRMLADDCALPAHPDVDKVRCEPSDADDAEYYVDAACSARAVVTPGDAPLFGRWDCDTFAPVTAETTGGPVFDIVGGICTPATLPTGWRQFAVGAPIELASLTRERGPGARIQPVTLVAGDLRVPDAWLHDTQLDADCHPDLVSGELRCVPATTSIGTYFTDAQCSQAVDVAVLDGSACTPAPRFAFRPDAYHSIGAAVTAPLYVMSTGDRCMPQPPAAPLEAHAVSGPLPLDTFVPAL